jgi:hypothetical protein
LSPRPPHSASPLLNRLRSETARDAAYECYYGLGLTAAAARAAASLRKQLCAAAEAGEAPLAASYHVLGAIRLGAMYLARRRYVAWRGVAWRGVAGGEAVVTMMCFCCRACRRRCRDADADADADDADADDAADDDAAACYCEHWGWQSLPGGGVTDTHDAPSPGRYLERGMAVPERLTQKLEAFAKLVRPADLPPAVLRRHGFSVPFLERYRQYLQVI